jgi:hypothetical protein
LHKKLAGISSALMLTGLLPVMVIGGLVSSSSSAHANLVVDAANATFSFTSKTNIVGNGTANNDVVRFNNVITVSGIAIDAVVTTTLVTPGGTAGANAVTITGYQKLSVARANSTIAYLKRLLPNVKFVRSGFAAGEPVADNSTTEGKAANRRAEVFIP